MIPSSGALLTIAISSILGSLHCIGMCGPLVALCCTGSANQQGRVRLVGIETVYHLTRLISYTALGALAGTLGSIAGEFGNAIELQRAFGIVSGSILVIWGLSEFGLLNKILPKTSVQSALSVKFVSQKLFKLPLRLTGVARGAFIGLLSGVLPCGWLYAYVITAAATQNAIGGMTVMAVFWLGTVPALVIFAGILRRVDSRWLQKIPKITALFIIFLGILTISGRLNTSHSMQHTGQSMSCH